MSVFTFAAICIVTFFLALGGVALLIWREERRLKAMERPDVHGDVPHVSPAVEPR